MMNRDEIIGVVHRTLEELHAAIVQGIEQRAAEEARVTGREVRWDSYRRQLDEWLASQKKRVGVDVYLCYPALASLDSVTQVH